METAKKFFRNFIIFIVLIALTFYILLKDQSLSGIFSILKSVKIQFIFIAFLCMCLYIICDAINIGRALKALEEKTSFFKNLKYSLIGFFFSAITPAAGGGQPMQVYFMYKDKITVANSTLTLLINLSCIQVVTISIAIFSLFFNLQYMNAALISFFIIGVTLNSIALTLLLISILSPTMSNIIINITVKILKFFRIKNIETKQEKLEEQLTKYQESAVYIKKHKRVVFKNLLTTYIQFILFYSIAYWVYRSFELSEHNIFEITIMQAMLYATVSGIPSPGAVGVTEGGFLAIFKKVFPMETIHGAMLLNRGINFYLFVIISCVIVMISTMKEKHKTELKVEKTEKS